MMPELSLNVLDIVQNSVKAKASLISISVLKDTQQRELSISIKDNGCGMTDEQISRVIDPFYTTRTTRKVGLGVPFFKLSAELTGGSFSIESKVNVGTEVCAVYCYEHIDMMPLGDMAATMVSLVSVNPLIDFCYTYAVDDRSFTLDTREVRTILEGVPLNEPPVLSFISDFIKENEAELLKENEE